MGCLTGRCLLLGICALQVIATIERQIFDFLGYMWAPIIANFFQIIFAILGFFGTYQYKPKYLITYITWTVIWIGWNSFIVCIYLEVGALKRDNTVLNMGTGSRSWWEVNGVGCNAKYNVSSLTMDGWKKPITIDDCLLDYQYVEVIHAGTQIALAIMGIIGACYIVQVFTQEDDSSRARKHVPVLPYSIEYRQQPQAQENAYQRPMTPRRVKRRSTRSKRGNASYRQSYYQNPVTRLMDRSSAANASRVAGADSSTSNDSYSNLPPPSYSSGHSAPPSYCSAASSMNILGLNAVDLNAAHDGGLVNPSYQSRPNSRPTSMHNGRPSPIYMNDSETVI